MQKRKREGVVFSSAFAGLVQGSCSSCTWRCASLCQRLGLSVLSAAGAAQHRACPALLGAGAFPGSPQSSCPSQLPNLPGPSSAAACGVCNPMALGIGLFLPHPCHYPGCCEGCGEVAKVHCSETSPLPAFLPRTPGATCLALIARAHPQFPRSSAPSVSQTRSSGHSCPWGMAGLCAGSQGC